MTHILLRNRDIPDIWQFDTYVKNGGYDGLKKAVQEYSPDEVIQIVLDANLRGRGGAGPGAQRGVAIADAAAADFLRGSRRPYFAKCCADE